MEKIGTASKPPIGAERAQEPAPAPGGVHQSQKEKFDDLMRGKEGKDKKRRDSPGQPEKQGKREPGTSSEQPMGPGRRPIHGGGRSAEGGKGQAVPGRLKREKHAAGLNEAIGEAGRGKKTQHGPYQLTAGKAKEGIGEKTLRARSASGGEESIGEKMLRARTASGEEASAGSDSPAMAAMAGANAPAPSSREAAASVQTAAPPAAAEINQLIDKTVSRILVSSPEAGQAQEIRLQLDGKLLGGTEVRLYNEGGQLNVEFLPQTADAGNFLSQQHGHIQETLSRNLKQQKVLVAVNHDAQKGSAEAKEGRRVERKQGTQSF